MRRWLIWALALLAVRAIAAERKFNFTEVREGQIPPGFRSTLTGEGKPGDWRVVLDEKPSAFPARTPESATLTKHAVLAQLAQDPTDEHFPLLIFEEETFGDFSLTTRFKTVGGERERMAGIAFRIQNETNYYVIRASSLGNTFRFYKVVNGQRSSPIGPEVKIASGEWHELGVQCQGNQIRCLLDGKEAIPTLTDNTFSKGKIGFWTKSDSVTYFADPKIVYVRREVPAQTLVREMLKKYPRLLALKVYVPAAESGATRVIASKNEKDIGQPGTKTESAVINEGQVYYGKEKDAVSVIAPLRDRNGEIVAAARVVMQPFAGQTEQNAIVRAMPIVKEMESRLHSFEDLLD